MTAQNLAEEIELGPGTWPRGYDRTPKHSIGSVVSILSEEFPATTVSKVRFLEDQGLVKPWRTGTGYRKYSASDVERIRFILTQQRDSYAPLKVIHEQLTALDGGHDFVPEPQARLVATGGNAVEVDQDQSISLRTLRDLTGASFELIEECTKAGLIHPDLGGFFPARAVRIVRLSAALAESGLQPRVLRSVRTSAERCAELAERVVLSRESRHRPGDKERSRAQAQDLSETIGELHQELLSLAVASFIDS